MFYALWIGWASILVLFLYSAVLSMRNQAINHLNVSELVAAFLPVDVDHFANLMATEQQDGRWPRSVQARNMRLGLMLDSLRRMSHNAALLQRLGYTQINSSNQLICELAQEMIDAGVYVRLYTFVGSFVLRVSMVLGLDPGNLLPATKIRELHRMMSESLIPAYERLKDRAGNLSCLKFSGYHEALVQSL